MRSSKLLRAVLLAALLSCAGSLFQPQDVRADNSARTIGQYGALPAGQPASAPHAGIIVDSLDDYDDAARPTIADPLEPWNRFWFGFNDIFYLHVARPAYRVYDFVMPDEFQSGLKNFLNNLLFPVRFVNCLLQGKPKAAGVEFGRFIVNSTVGFGGFINVTKGRKTVVEVDSIGEDFGQTLGVWGVGHGFYIVWPFIGPSSARESVGLAGDYFLDPAFYLQPWEVAWGTAGTLRFNSLGDILPTYESLNKAAVDPYIAMREAYILFREEHLKQ